jgi:Domain of Unknown Function (DUF1080)
MNGLVMVLLTALTGAALLAAEGKTPTFRFGRESLGRLPDGWKADKTGKGEGSVWKVVQDRTAPTKTGVALAQTAEGPKPLFNLCVAEGTSLGDVEVQVSLKAVKGKVDQGGGVVWRYRDADNYYVARVNPLEGNYRVYKVVAGKRVQLETAEDVKAEAGKWHAVKVRHVGDRIECYLDGKRLLEATDSALAGPGKVGLWTKADAQTHFDDFRARGAGR